MNRLAVIQSVLLLSLFAIAQQPPPAGRPNYEQDFQSGGTLKLELSAADYTIRGGQDAKIRVYVEASDPDKVKQVKFSTATAGSNGKLKIIGPHNNIHYTIEVPSRLDLTVRLSAGDLNMSGIEGSKDISMHAGDLNLRIANPEDYRDVDLSVTVGDLNAGPWSTAKSGFVRSYHQANAGKYKMHVHVGAGDLNVLVGD